MSSGWSIFIILLVVAQLVGAAWLLIANRRATAEDSTTGDLMEHEYDGLREYNNPMPAWWVWLFVGTLLWAPLYFLLFPGFGSFAGVLGWTSQGQHAEEVRVAEELYGPLFDRLGGTPIAALADDPQAVEIGARLFANNCSTCHGSDAQGGRGYPNLTDDDWLWGGAPEQIVQTITLGRVGNMPGMGAVVGEEGVANLAQYVLGLSGRPHDTVQAAAAAEQYAQVCAVCHGADGTGNQAVGAPNLTDEIWLHGGRVEDIEFQIRTGRVNQMPAHGDILGPQKVHILAAYVLSLGQGT